MLRASIRLRLGFRTAWEIGTERYALKALRGRRRAHTASIGVAVYLNG